MFRPESVWFLFAWAGFLFCRVLGLLCLGLLGMAPALKAESILLQPVADTTLLESAPDNNMGAWTHVAVGTTGNQADRTKNRGLFRFAVADALPRGARVTNAVLTLKVTKVPGNTGGGIAVNSTFALHRVLRAWGEGDKLGDRGDFATDGEASWNAPIHPAQLWSAPGAAAPTDFTAEASAETPVAGKGNYRFGPTLNLLADVQAWVNDPNANFGWLLLSQSEDRPKTARGLGSREDAPNAPNLLIEFDRPSPPRIDRFEAQGDEFRLSFVARAGVAYFVEFRDSLGAGLWSTLTNLPAQAAATDLLVIDKGTAPERFYRLGLR